MIPTKFQVLHLLKTHFHNLRILEFCLRYYTCHKFVYSGWNHTNNKQ